MGRNIAEILEGAQANPGQVNAIHDQGLVDEFWRNANATFSNAQISSDARDQVISTLINQAITKQKALTEQQGVAAEQKAIQGNRDRSMDQYTDSARMNLAQSMAGARAGANRRGLFYSGLRTGAENSLQGQAANDVAQYKQKVNTAAGDQLAGYSKEKAQNYLDQYNMANSKNISDYQAALGQRANQNSAISQIGGLAGGLAGSVLGGGNKPNG